MNARRLENEVIQMPWFKLALTSKAIFARKITIFFSHYQVICQHWFHMHSPHPEIPTINIHRYPIVRSREVSSSSSQSDCLLPSWINTGSFDLSSRLLDSNASAMTLPGTLAGNGTSRSASKVGITSMRRTGYFSRPGLVRLER